MKKIIIFIIVVASILTLTSCKEATAIKDGIKDKLPKPETPEVIEAIMDKPNVNLDKNTSLLVIQEVNKNSIIAIIDGTNTRYSIPNWFGDSVTLTPGCYILVTHSDNSLQTYPLQFGIIYSMQYFAADGSVIEKTK
jgi:hypothetical protein